MEDFNEDTKQEYGLPSIGIPAEILFNPLFSWGEKSLFGFIRILSAQPSGCFATNHYLANLIGMTRNSLSRSISRLKKAQYITIEEIDYRGYKKRVIRINPRAGEIYQPLINLVYPKYKKVEDWIEDKTVLKMANKLSNFDKIPSENKSDTIQEYKENHAGIKENSPKITNDKDSNGEIDSEINVSFSYEKEVIDSDESISHPQQHVDSTVCMPTAQEHNTVANISEAQVSPEQIENDIKVPPTRTRKIKDMFEPKQKPTPKIKKNIVSLIDYWNTLKIVQHRAGTKTYNEIAVCLNKLMLGKFFDKNGPFSKYADYKFSEQEITNTLNRFALAATDFNYEPTNGYKKTLKGTGIVQFLHNPFGEKERSLFLEYFETEPIAVKETMRMIEDVDPNMTEIIKDVWVKKVMNKYVPKSYSKMDENNFRRATKEFHRWFNENNKRIHPQFGTRGTDAQSKRKRVELFVEMLLKTTLTTSKIQISWLCSTYNWEHAFPKWCNDQGIMN